MANLVKSQVNMFGAGVIEHVAVSSGVQGTGISCVGPNWTDASLQYVFGRSLSGTAAFVNLPTLRIEGSRAASTVSDGAWVPIVYYQPQIGSLLAEQTVTNNLTGGTTTTLNIASTTNFAIDDIVFISQSTTAASDTTAEYGRGVSIVANTSITLAAPVNNSYTGSSVFVSRMAEADCIPFDVAPYTAIRAVIDGWNNAAQDFFMSAVVSYM